MNTFKDMLQANPRAKMAKDASYLEAIEWSYECARACRLCADACLGEEMVQSLRRCIRLNYDCADVCQITANMLARQVEPDFRMMREQLRVCSMVVTSCGEECKRHANVHAHCRICSEVCDHVVKACNKLVETLPKA